MSRVTFKRNRWSLALIFGILVAVWCQSAPAQITISYEQSGHVRLPDGQPVAGFVLRLYEQGVPLYRQTTTDADGRFEFFVEQFHTYTIATGYFNYGWQSISPEVRSGTAYTHYQFNDFTATPYPKVKGSVRDVNASGFSLAGVQVLVGSTVKDLTDSNGDYEFEVSPNQSGTISFRKSLHTFTPPTLYFQVGSWQTTTMPDVDMRLDNIYDNPNITASWEEDSGPGITAFPQCPANDFPHNPDVHAELYFAPAYLSTVIPADHLKLSSTPANVIMAPWTEANDLVGGGTGRVATFDSPVLGCGLASLTLTIGVDQSDGSTVWYDVATVATGASNVDPSGNGVINLSDVSYIAGAIGTHPGEPGYDACVDFNSDGVVDLLDVTTFAAHLGHTAAKSGTDWIDVEEPATLLASNALKRPDGTDVVLSLDLDRPWLSAFVELPGDGWTEKDLIWTPSRSFRGEVITVVGEDGRAGLQFVTDGTDGGGEIGTLTFKKGDVSLADGSLVLKGLRAAPDPEDEEQLREAAAMDDGTMIWSRRSVGGASGNPLDISFRLPQATDVDLEVFDLRGRSVVSLLDGASLQAGEHRSEWNGKDAGGRAVPAGMYFARLKSGTKVASQKLIVVR